MKFAIRDDDINYFTKPKELENIYKTLWHKCPISLSVVPFQISEQSGAVPREHWNDNRVFPLDNNKELVEFLIEKIKEGKIAITLHGYNHRGREFENGENLDEKIRKGKDYLENLFNTSIKVFVPPHNALSLKGMLAAKNYGLNLISVPSIKKFNRPLKEEYLFALGKRIYYLIRYKQNYPYIFNFSGQKELPFYSLTPSVKLEQLKKCFDFCIKRDGIFCLATHSWEWGVNMQCDRGTVGDIFCRFWKYTVRYSRSIQFSTVNRLFEEC